MTAPATEKAAPIPADGPASTVATILAWHHGRPVPTERDRVVAAEIVEALSVRDRQEERIREDERDRLYAEAEMQHAAALLRRDAIAGDLHAGAALWLKECGKGAMLPAERARQRGDAS